jgi:hypothetical protein
MKISCGRLGWAGRKRNVRRGRRRPRRRRKLTLLDGLAVEVGLEQDGVVSGDAGSWFICRGDRDIIRIVPR